MDALSIVPGKLRLRTRGGGVQEVLEGSSHNNVHTLIGGWMPIASSPRDPIFFMYHCNIDCIWAVWNLCNANSNDPLWTDMPFKDNFLNSDGSFWSPKVSDLYDRATLGYSYGLESMAVAANTANAPRMVTLRNKFTSLFVASAPAGSSSGRNPPAGIATVTAASTGTAIAAHPFQFVIRAPEGVLESLRRTATLGSGTTLLSFLASQERAASSTRVIAFLREVSVTNPRTTMFRVFVDHSSVSVDTPVTDPPSSGRPLIGYPGVNSYGKLRSKCLY